MPELERDPIDPSAYAVLEDVADGDSVFMIEIISQYLNDAPRLVETFALALARDEAETLEHAAHTLSSASANMGAMTLSQLCGDLRRVGRSGAVATVASQVAAATAEYERVRVELESRRTKLDGQG